MDEKLKAGDTVRIIGKHCTPGFIGKIGTLALDPGETIATVKFQDIKRPVMFLVSDIEKAQTA